MNKFLRIFVATLGLWMMAGSSVDAAVRVRGYTRKDGTYVAPHYRSAPDGNFSNNWSTKGNSNPYTGEPGTRVTPPGTTTGSSYSYSQPPIVYPPVQTTPNPTVTYTAPPVVKPVSVTPVGPSAKEVHEKLKQVTIGMNKQEVEAILGPSKGWAGSEVMQIHTFPHATVAFTNGRVTMVMAN